MVASLFSQLADRPLADRLRPRSLDEVAGQDHLLAPDAPLGRMVAHARLVSLVLWGPPGCGKTTIARLLADACHLTFEPVSAVAAGVADLRKIFDAASARQAAGEGTLLFVDEIHRFNRAQQDVLLPYVEDGTVVLVGATTENPSFELNGALLSRCQVFTLNRLDEAALLSLIERAEASEGKTLPVSDEARGDLVVMADGDGRYLLGMVQTLFEAMLKAPLNRDALASFVQKRMPLYDKAQDGHYNLISAFHKSLRGSDCDAALYWFARMLAGGEDARYIARRLLRFAAEDVGLADPQAMPLTLAAWESYERLGSPEGELVLAEAVVYLATAPKSNATYMAYKAAVAAAQRYGSLMPPKHILNAPTKMMREQGYGEGYAYDHDTSEGFSGQNYFPETMERHNFYRPVERGFEREIRKRLEYWDGLRRKKASQ
ncbi:MAG: replication-associated recombination protein A [Alphaproteobacteria bacterium]|nr:replication-associated recombination protein A [Alphaproteobacteria bacterium]